MNTDFSFRQLDTADIGIIKELFRSVFTAEPWNDDWSDEQQLDNYLSDLTAQSNSLTYGMFDGETLVGLSMGNIKHWYTGTEYYINELCIRTDRQGMGLGTLFLNRIESAVKEMGLTHIFLQTGKNVPAYEFYKKNGYTELTEHISFAKQI